MITLSAVVSPAAAAGTYSYEWFEQGNSTVLGNNPTFNVSPSTATTYVVVITDDGLPTGDNSGNAVQTIDIIGSPQLDVIPSTTECMNYLLPPISGSNLSGTAVYYDGPNRTGTMYAPGTILNFTDFASYPVTLYVYDENIGTTVSCPNEISFELTITQGIIADTLANVVTCTSYALPFLSPDNSFWSNSGGTGTSYNQGEFITSDTTIFVYADNGGCTDETQFTITINDIIADVLPDDSGCIDYILPPLNPNNAYYTAPNQGGTLLAPGSSITATSTLYIFAEVGTGSDICNDESSFTIPITGQAIADSFDDVEGCERYTLPALSTNNRYFDQMGATGTEFFEGDVITNNTTLYIYAGVPGCSAETDFDITINTAITVSDLEDVRACENYVLEEITAGRYFTQPGGQGIELFAFGVIDNTQTIYIYEESGACSAENEFTITIDCSPPPPTSCISFPNFFTPNMDGANDFFNAVNDASCTVNGIVSVFDRYGKLMRQFNAMNDSWDGTYNGIPAPSTEYWYRFIDSDTGAVITGHFSLKR